MIILRKKRRKKYGHPSFLRVFTQKDKKFYKKVNDCFFFYVCDILKVCPHQHRTQSVSAILLLLQFPAISRNFQTFQGISQYFKPFPAMLSHFLPFPAYSSHLQPFQGIFCQQCTGNNSHDCHLKPLFANSSHFQPFTKTYSHLQPQLFSAISGNFKLLPDISSHFKSFRAIYSNIQSFPVASSHFKKFQVMYSHLPPFTEI